MNGWVVIVLLCAAVLLGMWRWLRRDLGALQFVGAALLLALAGYAWQGRPNLPGVPKAAADFQVRTDSDFAAARRPLLGEFDAAGGWLNMAEGLIRTGNTLDAAKLLRKQLESAPRDMDLWLGYADALVQHAGGRLTPAAELAFNRAAQVAPDHPAPRFFYGLTIARLGQFDAADQYLQQALERAGESENWRTFIERGHAGIARMRASVPVAPAG